jgi:hypothetical protein
MARHNCALLLVDHTGKPQDRKGWTDSQSVYLAAGTSRKANGARCSCELTQCGEGDPRYRLRFGKNPERTGLTTATGGIVRDLFLEHAPTLEKPFWKISSEQDAPTAGKHDASIRRYLAKHPEAGDADIAEAIGCDRSTVYRWRQRAGK